MFSIFLLFSLITVGNCFRDGFYALVCVFVQIVRGFGGMCEDMLKMKREIEEDRVRMEGEAKGEDECDHDSCVGSAKEAI